MRTRRHDARTRGVHTSLSLASSVQVGSPDMQEPLESSGRCHDSVTESASSRETCPVELSKSNVPAAAASSAVVQTAEKEKELINASGLQIVLWTPSADRMSLSLQEVAQERVDLVAEKMKGMPEEVRDEIKNELRSILEGSGGRKHIEEFLYLQKLVQSRGDLTLTMLSMAHRVQIEILVAIKTGIQAFLHPSVVIPPDHLAEIFLHKRCRNIACQNALPGDNCRCNICTTRTGFCCFCMCVVCGKFDFDVNTCLWIGCDVCSHWTHTDCAIRNAQIGTGQAIKNGVGHAETLFRCQACHKTSQLLGWVKDVFQYCAPGWDRDALLRELDYVCKIFRLSEDAKGKKLFKKCADLIVKLRNSTDESMNPRVVMLQVLNDLGIDHPESTENEEEERPITPREACNRMAKVVQEVIKRMENVAEDKMRSHKKARLSVEACNRESEEKAWEAQELQAEKMRKQQQVEELKNIIRLKQAEAEMFQLKASEARQEADKLLGILLSKSKEAEQDYASIYLKRRLEEAEAERQNLIEKIKLQACQKPPQASSSGSGNPSQMMSTIQDLLKNVRSSSPTAKSDEQRSK